MFCANLLTVFVLSYPALLSLIFMKHDMIFLHLLPQFTNYTSSNIDLGGLARWLSGGAVLAARPDCLRLIPETHMVEGEN